MNKEIEVLKRIWTYEVVPVPNKRKIIESKSVYKTKRLPYNTIERHKNWGVEQGFSHMAGVHFNEWEISFSIVQYQ